MCSPQTHCQQCPYGCRLGLWEVAFETNTSRSAEAYISGDFGNTDEEAKDTLTEYEID